MLSLINKI
jgi:hypothetical protein